MRQETTFIHIHTGRDNIIVFLVFSDKQFELDSCECNFTQNCYAGMSSYVVFFCFLKATKQIRASLLVDNKDFYMRK